jgi:hypothetical protein
MCKCTVRSLTDIADIEDRIDLEEIFHNVDKTTQMLSTPVNATLNHNGEVHMRDEVPLRVVTVSPFNETYVCVFFPTGRFDCSNACTRDERTWVFTSVLYRPCKRCACAPASPYTQEHQWYHPFSKCCKLIVS